MVSKAHEVSGEARGNVCSFTFDELHTWDDAVYRAWQEAVRWGTVQDLIFLAMWCNALGGVRA